MNNHKRQEALDKFWNRCCFCEELVIKPDVCVVVPPIWMKLYFHRECFAGSVGFVVPEKDVAHGGVKGQLCQICLDRIIYPMLPIEIIDLTRYVVLFRFCPSYKRKLWKP